MGLKEIKPGMIVHCGIKEEARNLIEEAYKQGYEWNGNGNVYDAFWLYYEDTCYRFDDDIKITYGGLGYFANEYGANAIIEFSDLIIPELSAEEVIQICTEICERTQCNECPMGAEHCFTDKDSDKSKIIEICQKWKSDHEKKEPEIEWFWQGRIFQIYEDGGYYQIKDGAGFYDTGCEYRESAEEYMADTLKEYCKSHEGIYIATVEHVCRAKAVE